MRRRMNKLILNIRICIASSCGHFNRIFNRRRSRKDWPLYDNAYLWYGEEAYEFNHSGTDDEYMDVLGTIMILQSFPQADFHNRIRRRISITKKAFKIAFIEWWLRQSRRGRPNLSLTRTYQLFHEIHLDLKKLNNK